MRAAQLSRCAALLLLLGAALATVPGRPTVMEVRNGWGARGQGVSVASASQAGSQESYGYNDYGVEEKEVSRAFRQQQKRVAQPAMVVALQRRVKPASQLLANALQRGNYLFCILYGSPCVLQVCLQEVNRKDCHVHSVEGCNPAGTCDGVAGVDTDPTPPLTCALDNNIDIDVDCDPVTSFWT